MNTFTKGTFVTMNAGKNAGLVCKVLVVNGRYLQLRSEHGQKIAAPAHLFHQADSLEIRRWKDNDEKRYNKRCKNGREDELIQEKTKALAARFAMH